MENWKRALMAASAGLSVILLLSGKRTAGMLVAGVGLATLASEYPDEFADFRDNLPHYVQKGTSYLDVVSRVGERLAEATKGRGGAWYEALLER
ncbi:MAG: hypothetical protein H0X25_09545 [Acidobacteriales bacterium]|nr:hypothetical protein [Terriglobales bacterium]